MVVQLYEDQLGQVRHGNILSRPFKITNDVKQGYVLAPTLFTLFFSMMLQHVTEDFDEKMAFTFVFVQMQPVQPKTFASPHKDQGETDQGALVR